MEVPLTVEPGGSETCVPESVIEFPSSVPVAVLLLTAVQSANSGPTAPAGATASARAMPAASAAAHAATHRERLM